MNILSFAPHAAVWAHAFPEALALESLVRAGHQVTFLTCDRAFAEYCTCMRSHGLAVDASAEQKAGVCAICELHKNILRENFGFAGVELGALLTDRDRENARLVAAGITPETMHRLSILGVPVGRTSLFEVLIGNKKIALDFSPLEWRTYQAMLHNSLLVLFAMKNLCAHGMPHRVMGYQTSYSVLNAFVSFFEANGVPSYCLQAGTNFARVYQTMVPGRRNNPTIEGEFRGQWPRYGSRPASPARLALVTDHILELFKASLPFVYSAACTGRGNAREHFGIRRDQKLLVATMSSYDEVFTSYNIGIRPERNLYSTVFRLQTDWIAALLEYVRQRPELFLLIRVHPREFPNRRDSLLSTHARLLKETFTDLPANARINWPTDNISLYDLAEDIDVGLNAFSTTGLELSLLGIPVVAYDSEILGYHPDVNLSGTSREEYFANIETALAQGWSLERMRRAYRWLAMIHGQGSLDLSASVPFNQAPGAATPVEVNTPDGRRVRTFLQVLHCARRDRDMPGMEALGEMLERGAGCLAELARPDDVTPEQEDAGLRAEIGRLMQARYGGTDTPGDPRTLRARLDAAFHRLAEPCPC